MSDGWQDLSAHKTMTWFYERAENGNVALTGEVDLAACSGTFLVALAFGASAAEAGYRARASLFDGFVQTRAIYVNEWTAWHQNCEPLAGPSHDADRRGRVSAAVVRCHEEKLLPGGIIAMRLRACSPTTRALVRSHSTRSCNASRSIDSTPRASSTRSN